MSVRFQSGSKCENKWRELLHAEDAQKGGSAGSASRGQRKVGDPTPSDRAAGMLVRLREARKAEIKSQLATVKEHIVETEKELNSIDSAINLKTKTRQTSTVHESNRTQHINELLSKYVKTADPPSV